MTTARTEVDPVAAASARGAAYGVIAEGFRYPDETWLTALREITERIERLLSEPDTTTVAKRNAPRKMSRAEARSPGFSGVVDHATRFDASAVKALAELCSFPALKEPRDDNMLSHPQKRYVDLFGHTVRGSCPPYELEYGEGEIIQRASELADITGFYAAFGLEMKGDAAERADHVTVEAEFMCLLCRKEAYGLEAGMGDLVESSRDAQRKFLRSHLGRWIPAFSRRVCELDGEGFFGRLARFSEAFIAGECRRFEVPEGSPYMVLRPADPSEEAAQSCGPPGSPDYSDGQRLTPLKVCTDKISR